MTRIVLRQGLCPGDVTVMTVVPRELYRHYPGKFEISVQTNHPGIWENNPYIVHHFSLKQTVPSSYKVIDLHYDVKKANDGDLHFMHAFLADAARQLAPYGVESLPLTEFRPCICLTDEEKKRRPSVDGVLENKPFWLIMAGGKQDVSTKWWDQSRWQHVAHRLATDPKFPLLAQVGKGGDMAIHYRLQNCASLLDMTNLRELIWLTYCSRGVICGVTCLMHIAAALSKPAVVVAGGREAWWWDSYDQRSYERHRHSIPERFHELLPLRPPHIYLDTIGGLQCCAGGGCWKKGIGEKPVGENCVDLIKPEHPYDRTRRTMPQPRCMTMITADMVLEAVRKLDKTYN